MSMKNSVYKEKYTKGGCIMDKQEKHLLRHHLNIVGWGLFLYFTSYQLMTIVLLLAAVLVVPSRIYESETTSTVITCISVYLICPLVLWLFIRKIPSAKIEKHSLNFGQIINLPICTIGATYLIYYITLGVMEILKMSGIETNDVVESALGISIPFYIISFCIIAPVFEELIFRKLLLEHLLPFGEIPAICISAAAFGLFHMNLYQLFYTTVMGLIFAWVVLKTGKVRYSIILHAFANFTSYIVSLVSEVSDAWSIIMFILILLSILWTICSFVFNAKNKRFLISKSSSQAKRILTNLIVCPGIWACTLTGIFVGILTALWA